MPLAEALDYIIDFSILESNDLKAIYILDKSTYITPAEKPVIDVILPGFTGYVSTTYTPGTIIVLNSDNLDLTDATEYADLACLPDGVYQITMKVCPYEELYNKQCYLHTARFKRDYTEFLINLEKAYKCFDEQILEQELMEIELLLISAKAEVTICNAEKAAEKYKIAVKKLNKLNKKLNCK